MSLGVPDTIVFNPKPRATSASRIRQTFLPINGRSFAGGDQVHFSLACGRRGAFLDCKATYLKFTITNSDATALALDHSAHSAIQLLEIYYGSTQLEYINQYNALVTALLDTQSTSGRTKHQGEITEGASDVRAGVSIAGNGSITVCIPLVSGIIGSLAEKYLPVGMMTRDNLRLSLTLPQKNDLQHSAASVDWTISDMKLQCEYVMINSEVARQVEMMSPQGLRIPMTSFSVQSNTVPAGGNQANILLSGNFRSVKTLLTIFRVGNNLGAAGNIKAISSRVNPIQSTGYWQFDVGGFKVPQTPVEGDVETFLELQKAFHNYNNMDGHGIHTPTTWSAATTGSFLIGQDLDHFSGKSMLAESGVDVSTSSVYLEAKFSGNVPANGYRVDTYFHYDGVLYIAPDGSAAQTLV